MHQKTTSYGQILSGKRILVVEAGYFLMDEVRRTLVELGVTIVGPIDDLEYARELVKANEADAVILDLSLAAKRVFPLVELLEQQKLPYVFAQNGEPIGTQDGFTGFMLSEKPVAIEHIAKALFGKRRKIAKFGIV